jgi:tetratricopeptide (TPR) repeat protein
MEQILPSDKIIVPLQPQEFTADQTKVDIDILKPFEMPASANKTVTAVQPSMETNAELENIRKMIKEQQDREEANKLIKKAISYKWQAQLKEAEKPVGLKSYKQRTAEGETSSGLTAEPTTKTAATGGGAAEQPRKFAQDSNIYDHEFNEKMAQAQKLMEEGKFYQAVDAYTYATLYKPLEPSGYVGKSLAFLAAGEYLSSAQLLSAGLKLSADYAKVKQDLSKLITDKDKFQVRFRDLDKSAAENLKPELLYLLAYTCFQTDQIAKAQQAIDIAAKAMPYDKAISDLKKIIDESRSTR